MQNLSISVSPRISVTLFLRKGMLTFFFSKNVEKKLKNRQILKGLSPSPSGLERHVPRPLVVQPVGRPFGDSSFHRGWAASPCSPRFAPKLNRGTCQSWIECQNKACGSKFHMQPALCCLFTTPYRAESGWTHLNKAMLVDGSEACGGSWDRSSWFFVFVLI